MKICFYNHTGQVSGAERVLFSILSGSYLRSHEVVVFTPESDQFESFCAAHGLAHRAVCSLQARYTWNPVKLLRYFGSSVRLVLELRRSFARESPHLIHANGTRAAIITSLATLGSKVPVIWHVHDNMARHPLSSLIRTLAIWSGRNQIVAVSRATANRFIGSIPKRLQGRAPVHVIHNGIDTNRFTQSREGMATFLNDIGLDQEHFRIGIVGQITPRKGHLALIRSVAPLLHGPLPQARLLIIGAAMFNNDIAYLEKLKMEVSNLHLEKRVLFLGVRDAHMAMKALNVLVLNSSNEPFGLVLTEAMASGTPVVAAAVDGVPEIVEHEISGLLFEPGDRAMLAQHLLSLSTNERRVETLTTAARKRVADLFDHTRLRSQIFALYERLTNPCVFTYAATVETRSENV